MPTLSTSLGSGLWGLGIAVELHWENCIFSFFKFELDHFEVFYIYSNFIVSLSSLKRNFLIKPISFEIYLFLLCSIQFPLYFCLTVTVLNLWYYLPSLKLLVTISNEIDLFPSNHSGGGNSNPLQYFYLEDPLDRGDWWATVHEVTKSWTEQHACTHALSQVMEHSSYSINICGLE